MSADGGQRKVFALLQVLVGFTMPGMFLFVFSGSVDSLYEAAYWFGLPALVYLAFSWLCLSRRGAQFRLSRSGIEGAAIAGYLAFVIPAIFLWFTSAANYKGCGANIGVAMLVVALPIYLPLAMGCGFAVGESLARTALFRR